MDIQVNFHLSMYAFFLCYSIYKLFSLFYMYYSTDATLSLIARVSLVLGAFLFVFILNQIFFKQIFSNDKHRFIFVFSLIASVLIFAGLYFIYSGLLTLTLLLGAMAILISILVYKSLKWFLSLSESKKIWSIFLIGCCFFIAGAAFSRVIHYIPELISLNPIANTIEISGVILISLGIWKLPNLAELDWKKKLLGLYIIEPTGICIFNHTFSPSETIDSLLIGGGITGVVNIVKEMTKSDAKLSNIKQGNRSILLEYGKYVTVALIVEEDLEIIRRRLKSLLTNFEEFFRDVFPTWKHDLDIFKPAKVLVEKIFQ